MGQAGSVTAKAVVHPLLRVFTTWTEKRIQELVRRCTDDLSDTFALRFGEFEHLLNRELVVFTLARDIFRVIFDTDNNKLVDKYEVTCLAILMSSVSTQKKIEYLFDIFDFGGKDFMSMAEAKLMFITVVNASHKADSRPSKPTPNFIEILQETLFTIYCRHDTSHDFEDTPVVNIRKKDLVSYAGNTADVRGFLEFWRGIASQVLIPETLKWRDPWFLAAHRSIVPSPEWMAQGHPPPSFVCWRRHGNVGKGATRLLSHRVTQLKTADKMRVYSGPGIIGTGQLRQGLLADRWLLNAIAMAIMRPKCITELFSFTGQEERGRFCARIFEGGSWRSVFVDDRIPCGPDGDALFSKSSDDAEFFLMLYEKAVAKYLKSFAFLGSCGMRADAVYTAARWMTGGHVMRAAVTDFSWKSLDSENRGESGFPFITELLKEGSIVSFGRSEGMVLTGFTMGQVPWEGPPHGRFFPVIGTELVKGYKILLLRDAWGTIKSATTNELGPNLATGHNREFPVRIEDLADSFDTICVIRFPDALRHSAEELKLKPWSTHLLKAQTGGPQKPSSFVLRIPEPPLNPVKVCPLLLLTSCSYLPSLPLPAFHAQSSLGAHRPYPIHLN